MLQLRQYQERSLEVLEAYLRLATEHGAQKAFVLQTSRPYLAVKQLPGLPYVCLRVPTGGGKTLMACHAVGIAAKTFLQIDRAVCLWLVPSNTIREQTLAALRDRQHPYRQALDSRFAGQVRAMDLTEALYVQRNTLEGETVIIVATLAALRVEDTDGRKVYEPCGALSHHFSGLDANLESVLEQRDDGTIPHSLANVLRLWRPLVIMDEAHNARTHLSFDTLARFNPSCIIEFTATPETTFKPEQELFASNVLHHVSAAELKAEDMVKLPIKLRTRSDWKEVLGEAVEMQRLLERCATEEERQTGEYLRPIVLLQAQPRSQERPTLTVEVVKKSLLEDFRIPEEQIAIATGQTREIDNINLLDRSCPLRFIITVQALKEGWDCPFAYILCSVAEISSSRAIEQILGRVLRLPQARRKQKPELNFAYAFVASPKFIEAASTLKDALVENGFERFEAEQLITAQQESGNLFEESALFARASQQVSQGPDLSILDEAIRDRITYDSRTGELAVTGSMSHQEMEAVKACFIVPEDRAAVERIYHALQGHAIGPAPTSEKRPAFRVPLLAIRVDGHLELFEESYFKDIEWRLADCDALLSEVDFPSQEAAGETGEVDVNEAGKVEIRFVDQLRQQMALLNPEPGWNLSSLVNWLDRQIIHKDITFAQSVGFIHNVITSLMDGRGLTVEQLARQKFRLRNAVEAKIAQHRETQTRDKYNSLLFGPGNSSIEVRPDLCFEFQEDRYSPNWPYQGSFRFRHHYFNTIGELDAEGEEFKCAVCIDNLPQVSWWVRNLARSDSSFWLQTSTDRFYPDFVALLNDGRILVVEYKGADRWGNPDSEEKLLLGELWASRSDGRCLFVMPKGPNWQEITAVIERPSKWSLAADGSLFR